MAVWQNGAGHQWRQIVCKLDCATAPLGNVDQRLGRNGDHSRAVIGVAERLFGSLTGGDGLPGTARSWKHWGCDDPTGEVKVSSSNGAIRSSLFILRRVQSLRIKGSQILRVFKEGILSSRWRNKKLAEGFYLSYFKKSTKMIDEN